ncbi:MAG: hypothetical protein G3M70_08345 [Candidatus Nitronauta litoralis]|uniref:Uncharacterized protein n=1 Tax=Candidatus Nitronauta litoralis TaxID=2705533 RepID=A0A7T0BW15_9BACT|nr:MAG: hypothetical protein G3M70_08345 [Candidatus Nitronauta litoralis]
MFASTQNTPRKATGFVRDKVFSAKGSGFLPQIPTAFSQMTARSLSGDEIQIGPKMAELSRSEKLPVDLKIPVAAPQGRRALHKCFLDGNNKEVALPFDSLRLRSG